MFQLSEDMMDSRTADTIVMDFAMHNHLTGSNFKTRVKEMGESIEYLPLKHKNPGSVAAHTLKEPSAFNPRAGEAEAGRVLVPADQQAYNQ